MIPSLLFLGNPGIGKSTQCRLLAARHSNLTHIVSSEQLQAYAAAHDDAYSDAIRTIFAPEGTIKTPQYLDDASLLAVHRVRFATLIAEGTYDPAAQYALLDGVIRTVGQAEGFRDFFDVRAAIHLDASLLSPEELERRWRARGREGETLELFKERIEVYRAKTLPLLEHYQDRLHTVDPSGSVEAVAARLEAIVSRLPPVA